jgi:hypothetical protein
MANITGKTTSELEAIFNLQKDPVQPLDLMKVFYNQAKVIFGTLTVANGASTGTASVGAAYDGKPVIATLNEVDGVKTVVAAVVAAGTLTVTLSAATTDDRTVAYMIVGI